MEDIIKVFIYGLAILLWILYKAREQKKSGMWTPRSEEKPVVVPTQQSKSVVTERNIIRPNPPPKILKPKNIPLQKKRKEIQLPEPMKDSDTWNSPFYNQILKDDLAQQNAVLMEEQRIEDSLPDIRQAIIWTEILKRPVW